MKIKDIPSFLKKIKKAHTKKECNIPFRVKPLYYRGQSSIDWNISPSIFRSSSSAAQEYTIINKAEVIAHSHLKDCKSSFEKLIIMQHFGLHTRLLDITTNPLVALYFACNQEKENDAVVYWGCREIETPIIANLISEIVFEKDWDCFTTKYLEVYSKRLSEILKIDVSVKTLIELLSQPHCIYAPYNSPRITAQYGAFIVAPLFDKSIDEFYYKKKSWELTVKSEDIFCDRIVIDKDYKQNIMDELSEIGINEASMFPDMEHKMNYINTLYRNNYTIDV